MDAARGWTVGRGRPGGTFRRGEDPAIDDSMVGSFACELMSLTVRFMFFLGKEQ